MNAKIITSSVSCLPAYSMIFLSACFLAGRTRADTPPPQVVIDPKIAPVSDKAAQDLGVNLTVDKSQYNLFKMTPPELRRPFYTDFGAASPYTIDAGAFAIDTGFAYNTREQTKNDVQRTMQSWDLGYTTLKVGLWNRADLEVGLPIWRIDTLTLKDPDGQQDSFTRSGFGNVITRFKYNLFGNDTLPPAETPGRSCCFNGACALSLSADMIWPTASSDLTSRPGFRFMPSGRRDTNNENDRRDDGARNGDQYMGGLSLQYGYQTSCGMQLRINSGFILGENDCGWTSTFNNRISISQPVISRLSVLGAFDTAVSTANRTQWQGQVQAGFIYEVTPNLQLYLGSGFGVTERTYDYSPNIRIAARF